MNIWTQPPLDIGYHCSLTHDFFFDGSNDQCYVTDGNSPQATYNFLLPQESIPLNKTNSFRYWLKCDYRPILNGNSVYFSTCMSKIAQLFFYCEQAIHRVQLLVLEREKNQSEETKAFWKNKLLCPISGMLLENPVRDNHGHIFEKAAIDAHVKHSHLCPINQLPIQNLTIDTAYSAYVEKAIEQFLLPQPHGDIPIHDAVAEKHLATVEKYLKNEKYDQALSLYDVICKHSNKSSAYEILPHILLQLQDRLKAALAYLYLAMRQIEEKIDAEASIEKAIELLSTEVEIHALRAFYLLFQNKPLQSKKAFCILVEQFTHNTDKALPLLGPALSHLQNNLQIYHEIAARVSDTVKMRLYLIGIADFHKRDANISKMFYDKAHALQPNSSLPHLARLCRLERGHPERLDLYEIVAKNFEENGDGKHAKYCLNLCEEEKSLIKALQLPPMPSQIVIITKESSMNDDEHELIPLHPDGGPPSKEKILETINDFGSSLIEKGRNLINEFPQEGIEVFTEIQTVLGIFSNLSLSILNSNK